MLVGLDTADDAAVYKLNDETALIQTLDFFTPMIDDPYIFGQIAAANSLSDVYAMGGKPIVAMNIVCFPSCHDMNILAEILKGGFDKVKESGALLVGGHTVDDKEPKYGLSISGIVHPEKVLSNATARVGDKLILTKPIGVGILNTAMKENLVSKEISDKVIEVMVHLNKYAAKKGNHKDWCYVYNFENNREPLIIGLEKGLGKIFKKDIEKLIETLLDELRDAFESEDFEIGKNQLIEEYEIEKDALLKKIKKYAEEKEIKAYISLEEHMACGVGACLGCVVKTKEVDHHSHVHNARICTDGPVFDAEEVEI